MELLALEVNTSFLKFPVCLSDYLPTCFLSFFEPRVHGCNCISCADLQLTFNHSQRIIQLTIHPMNRWLVYVVYTISQRQPSVSRQHIVAWQERRVKDTLRILIYQFNTSNVDIPRFYFNPFPVRSAYVCYCFKRT